jgi:hypothetical protein
MGNQETPFVDPERLNTDQKQMFPEHSHKAYPAFQQCNPSVLLSILLLLLGYLVIAILYGIALI